MEKDKIEKVIMNKINSGEIIEIYVSENNYSKIENIFKNFEWANGDKVNEYNPYKEIEEIGDLIKMTFFKNSNGELRVMAISASSLLKNDNVEKVLNGLKLDDKWNKKNIEDLER